MQIGKKFASASIAAAFVALSAGAALAVPAHATGNVNVRTGPGVGYHRVDTLHSGENVDVQQCRSGWCYVSHSGPDGWVSANYLSQSGQWSGGSSGGNSDPDIGFSFGFGTDSGSFGFSFGNRPGNDRPRPPRRSMACFYSGNNYSGSSFCMREGNDSSFVGANWNDKISSVRIFGDVSVTMCQHAHYRGFCRTTSHSEPALGPWLNNEISAIRVN